MGWDLTFAGTPNDAALKPVVVRRPSTRCGGYLSHLSQITGVQVFEGFEREAIDAFFAAGPDLEGRQMVIDAETGLPTTSAAQIQPGAKEMEAAREATVPAVLFLNGLPWPKSEAAPIIKDIEARVAQLGLSTPPKIILLRRPSSAGLKRVYEELSYLLIPGGREDWSPISRSEVRQGMQSVLISSGITITAQTLTQGLAIGLPAGIVNMLFSTSTTIPRPYMGNYFARHSHPADVWGKQIWMTIYFTAGVYWAAKILQPDLPDILTWGGWGHFFAHKWNSILMQTTWRTPMENGLNKWISDESNRGTREEFRARHAGAVIRKIGTIVSTNFWLASVLLKNKPLFHALGTDWNIGHAGMALSAVVFLALQAHPDWYNIVYKDWRTQKAAEIRVRLANGWKRFRQRSSSRQNATETSAAEQEDPE